MAKSFSRAAAVVTAPPARAIQHRETEFPSNILLIALGCRFLAIARSYSRDGDRIVADIVAAVAVCALAAGALL